MIRNTSRCDVVDSLEIRRVNEQIGRQRESSQHVSLNCYLVSPRLPSVLIHSFPHPPSSTRSKCLPGAPSRSSEDPLYGLKENVIIGKLIPAGTGFVHGRFSAEENLLDAAPVVEIEPEAEATVEAETE